MTAETLKILLATPGALFVVMLLGSLVSALKQVSDAKRNGATMGVGSYLAKWPETVATLITNVLGFLTLVVTDQLNFASALGIGYAANSAADLIRNGGRSAELAQSMKQGGFARISMLVAMTVGAMLLLTACAPNQVKPTQVLSVACAPSDQYQIERCAEAIGDVYEVYLTRVHDIVADPALPADVREKLQRLDRELTPAVRTLVQTSAAYVRLREASAPAASIADAEREVRTQLAVVEPKVRTLPQL